VKSPKITLLLGDTVERMRGLPEGSVAAYVVDPPYGLEFMGKEWDKLGGGDPNVGRASNSGFSDSSFKGFRIPNYGASANLKCRSCGRWQWDHIGRECEEPDFPPIKALQSKTLSDWHENWLREAFRTLRPCGLIKAFAATRTMHRLVAAMRSAGFEIVRLEAWLYGSGFPKSLNVSKAIDAHLSGEREVVGHSRDVAVEDNQGFGGIARGAVGVVQRPALIPVTAPATPEAIRFAGYGTALKPAWEPFIVGRKPA